MTQKKEIVQPIDALREKETLRILEEYERSKKIQNDHQNTTAFFQNFEFKNELKSLKRALDKIFFRLKNYNPKQLEVKTRNNPLIKFKYPEDPKILRSLGYVLPSGNEDLAANILRKKQIWEAHQLQWREFCDKWAIKSSWDGKKNTLSQYVPSMRIEVTEDANGRMELLLCLNPWATRDEYRAKWKEINIAKKMIFGKKGNKKHSFSRHLCWCKLTQLGYSVSDISQIWKKYFYSEIKEHIRAKMNKKIKGNIKYPPNEKERLEQMEADYCLGSLEGKIRKAILRTMPILLITSNTLPFKRIIRLS